MIPPITTRSPSPIASTSTSNASSRNRSIRTGCSGATLTASRTYDSSRDSSNTMAIARPPRTYEGRTSTGKPIRAATSLASASERAVPLSGCGMPSSESKALKRFRSSARSIASGLVPRIVTPARWSGSASFKGVCPPNWITTPSGRSSSMTFITSSNVRGSK